MTSTSRVRNLSLRNRADMSWSSMSPRLSRLKLPRAKQLGGRVVVRAVLVDPARIVHDVFEGEPRCRAQTGNVVRRDELQLDRAICAQPFRFVGPDYLATFNTVVGFRLVAGTFNFGRQQS